MNFFKFTCEDKKGTLYIQISEPYNYFELATGNISFENTVHASVKNGNREFDFILLGDGFNIAVSKKVYLLLKKSKASGISLFPIKIEGVSELYYGLQITGRSGPVKEAEEGFVTGFDFNYDTWDKSDFFSPQGTAYKFCSERIMKVLVDNKVSNVSFINIKDVKRFV